MTKYSQASLPINKYGNVQTYYNLDSDSIVTKENKTDNTLRFDSYLEYEVYKILRAKFSKDVIKHHYTVEILPKTNDGIRAINWCVDFAVFANSDNCFYIEAKGVEIDDFKIKMNLLKRFKPLTANRLITVFKPDLFTFAHIINVWELWQDDKICPSIETKKTKK
jgi:hypothetical protein